MGKFDITFKSIVPIYDEDESFLGLFEIITHFNSIAKALEKNNVDVLVLANKKYKKQLTNSITKIFIDDYYVANLNASKSLIGILKDLKVDTIINNKSYYIDEKNKIFITKYKIHSNIDSDLGYIIIMKNLDNFDLSNILSIKKNIFLITLVIIFLIISIGYYLINKDYKKDLNKKLINTNQEKEMLDSILSAQPYIILLIYDNKIDYVNNKFFEFFN